MSIAFNICQCCSIAHVQLFRSTRISRKWFRWRSSGFRSSWFLRILWHRWLAYAALLTLLHCNYFLQHVWLFPLPYIDHHSLCYFLSAEELGYDREVLGLCLAAHSEHWCQTKGFLREESTNRASIWRAANQEVEHAYWSHSSSSYGHSSEEPFYLMRGIPTAAATPF